MAKEDLEIKIANEKISKPRINKEFMTFWLHRFRKLDVSQKSHRKMLIDTFVNAIYLYDDKMLLIFNFKDVTKTITFDDVKDAQNKYGNGSDLDWRTAPIAYFVSYQRSPEQRSGLLHISKAPYGGFFALCLISESNLHKSHS
ncbi:MAG: hypothetical protein LUH56_01370 [Oscillospiraceae bacterium]|nr:hypothetical protein [Oscillospiraceae bacterium]